MTRIQHTHAEPFDGRELRKYLERRHGAEWARQSGSHGQMKLPNGATVPMVAGNNPVTNLVMRSVAKTLNMDYRDLRADMGYPIPVRRKGRVKTQTKRQPGKKDVVNAIADLRRELTYIESEVGTGDRDPYAYQRAHDALTAALAEASVFRTGDQLIRDAHLPSTVP